MLGVVACSNGSEPLATNAPETPSACQAGELELAGGSCQPAGLPTMACEPGEIEVEGGCCPAGTVGPDCSEPGVLDCADGFVTDGNQGCSPVLPRMDCPPGQVALPGDSACRPLVDCGTTTWGSIPVEPNTVYVDASFLGTSLGSAGAPFTTIESAVAAAEPGAIVAIAAGSYASFLALEKPVRLWGRCPDLVTLSAQPDLDAITFWSEGASGSEIHALSIEGGATAIKNLAADAVVVERVWVKNTSFAGVRVHGWKSDTGNVSLTLRQSLVEGVEGSAVQSLGSDMTVEDSVLRDGVGERGGGVVVQAYPFPNGQPGIPDVAVRRVLVERTQGYGMHVMGATASIEDVVVRDTQPISGSGRGIEIAHYQNAAPALQVDANVVVRRSLVENTTEVGILVAGAAADLQQVVVRHTRASGVTGRSSAIHSQPQDGIPAELAIADSLVAENTGTAIGALSSRVVVDRSVIRDALAVPLVAYGVGVITASGGIADRGTLDIRESRIEANDDFGVVVYEGDTTLDGTLVVGTRNVSGGIGGTGVETSSASGTTDVATVTLLSSAIRGSAVLGVRSSVSNVSTIATLIDNDKLAKGFAAFAGVHRFERSAVRNTSEFGIAAEASHLDIEATLVDGVDAGPGIQLFAGSIEPAQLTLRASAIEGSRGFGLLLFDAHGVVEATRIGGITADDDGYFGDGITAMSSDFGTLVDVRGSSIGDTERAGIANFGAHVRLETVALGCSGFFLNGEIFADKPYAFDNRGGNRCACGSAEEACKVQSSSPTVPVPSNPGGFDGGTVPIGGYEPNGPDS